MSSFDIDGLEQYIKELEEIVEKWEQNKIKLLQRLGTIMEAEIAPKIPVDTSRLVSSFSVTVNGSESVEYSTNVEYALYVNDGHVQHKRFLPIRYISAGGRSKYIKGNNQKGIMLKEKYIAGKHFVEQGMATANPRIDTAIDSFLDKTFGGIK